MITVRVGELIHPNFKNCLLALKDQEMEFGTAFKINSLLKKIETKIIEFEEKKFPLLKEYCKIDEKGEFVMDIDEQGNPIKGSVVPIEEKKPEFMQKFGALLNEKVTLDVAKINPNALKDTKVTMNDLAFLEVFLENKPNLTLV